MLWETTAAWSSSVWCWRSYILTELNNQVKACQHTNFEDFAVANEMLLFQADGRPARTEASPFFHHLRFLHATVTKIAWFIGYIHTYMAVMDKINTVVCYKYFQFDIKFQQYQNLVMAVCNLDILAKFVQDYPHVLTFF